MGLLSWWRNWQERRRKKKELQALEHLRRFLTAETQEVNYLSQIVTEIEQRIAAGNFSGAEELIPDLAKRMKRKKLEDKLEEKDFKNFKKSLLQELKFHLKGVR